MTKQRSPEDKDSFREKLQPGRRGEEHGSPPARASGRTLSEEVEQAFERSVGEGEHRLSRTWPGLFATGTMGGIDVGVGVFALLIVQKESGDHLLSSLAFSIGFVALVLGNSELFTENFLVPITAVAAGKSEKFALVRLWAGTAVTNLAGGWVLMVLVISAYPDLGKPAIEVARFYPEHGIGWQSFAMAILGGTVITLMTWMERASRAMGGKLLAAVTIAFVLAAAPLNHAIVVSLEMFAALTAGAPFGYADWLGVVAWSSLGNLVGGIGLVTVLRLIQVGRQRLQEERHGPTDDEPTGTPADTPTPVS